MLDIVTSKVQADQFSFVFNFKEFLDTCDAVVFYAEMLQILELIDMSERLQLAMVYCEGSDGLELERYRGEV